MKRFPLNKDDVVQLNSRLYTIESVIGDGATCIVYSAYYRDGLGLKHRVNLKECYPYSANISREQQVLTWNTEEERDQWLDSFQNAYEKLMTWQNAYDTVNVFDLCEANNTLYIIMNADKGKTFDKDQPESLRDVLNTVKLLAHSVGRYHKNGFLHLDVKPSNFLVYPRPIEHIVLFDLDSVTSMDDIRAGKMKGVSYSDGWAAPEQKQRKISRLCPATDIFAIGAILFEKVMGRQVEAFDMGVFAEWNFEGELFEDVNPKIKRLLREIFHKTLAANVKRRYQTTGDLEGAIEKALGACASPFLQPDYPANTGCFVGRKKELNQISEAFAAGAHLVALKGIGGIGKSEIAKQYACLHAGDYDAVVYCQYKGAISDLLGEIEIHNFEGDGKSHQRQLHLLLDKEVLLIVDGFDSDSDPDFSELERLKCRVLITSRLDWEEYSIPTIKIEAMPVENQMELFLKEFGGTLDTNQEQVVLEILKLTEGYTLLIPLLAKQLRKGVSGFEETLMNLRLAGIKEASAGKVRQLKDGMPMSGTVYGILSQVLNMAGFSEDEVYIMRSLALLSQYRIDQKEFINWVGKEYLEQIDDLVFAGWILREEQWGKNILTLHAVIADLCIEELKPNLGNCFGIANHFSCLADEARKAMLDSEDAQFAAIEEKIKQLLSFLCSIDYNFIENLIYSINVLYTVIDSNIENADTFGSDSLTYIVKRMSVVLPQLGPRLGDVDLFKATNLFETMWCSNCQPLYDDEKTGSVESKLGIYVDNVLGLILGTERWDAEACNAQFVETIKAAKAVPDGFRKEAMYRTFYPAFQCMEKHLRDGVHITENGIRYNFACEIKHNFDIVQNEFKSFGREVDVAWIENCYNQIVEYIQIVEEWDSIQNDMTDELDSEIEEGKPTTCSQSAFEKWSSEIIFYPTTKQANDILRDSCLNDVEKAHLLALYTPFHSWYHKAKDINAQRWLSECNWRYFEELLDIQTELLWSMIDEWNDDDERLFREASVNRAIVWAILGLGEPFEMQSEILLEDHLRDAETVELDTQLSLWHLESSFLGYAINALRCIYKPHWILPYILKYMEYLVERVRTTEGYEEADLLDIYKYVYEIAAEANQIAGDSTDTYKKLLSELRTSITSITGVEDVMFPK